MLAVVHFQKVLLAQAQVGTLKEAPHKPYPESDYGGSFAGQLPFSLQGSQGCISLADALSSCKALDQTGWQDPGSPLKQGAIRTHLLLDHRRLVSLLTQSP